MAKEAKEANNRNTPPTAMEAIQTKDYPLAGSPNGTNVINDGFISTNRPENDHGNVQLEDMGEATARKATLKAAMETLRLVMETRVAMGKVIPNNNKDTIPEETSHTEVISTSSHHRNSTSRRVTPWRTPRVASH